MSNLNSFTVSIKMRNWGNEDSAFKKKYIQTMLDIMDNMINDGNLDASIDTKMGVGSIDLNQTQASEENFANYMKHFSNRFNFAILDTQG